MWRNWPIHITNNKSYVKTYIHIAFIFVFQIKKLARNEQVQTVDKYEESEFALVFFFKKRSS